MDEEERKLKMDDGVNTSLASKRTDLFVDLWEAQACLRFVSQTLNSTNYYIILNDIVDS